MMVQLYEMNWKALRQIMISMTFSTGQDYLVSVAIQSIVVTLSIEKVAPENTFRLPGFRSLLVMMLERTTYHSCDCLFTQFIVPRRFL